MRTGILFLALFFFVGTAFSQPINDIEALINKGDLAAVLVKIDAALKPRPNDAQMLTQKVRVHVLQKKYVETEALANRLITRDPKNKIAINARGVAKREGKKDFVGALADFDKALALDPEYVQAAFNRALTLYGGKLGKKSDALDAFSLAIELNPENAAARAVRGRLLNDFGRYKLALADFNQAISTNKNIPVYADRAYAEINLGADKQGLQDAETALRMDANNSLALAIRAYCNYSAAKGKESQRDQALADAEKAFKLNPNNYIAQVMIGFDKAKSKKDTAGAFAEYAAAYKLNPNSDWVVGTLFDLLKDSPDLRKSDPTAETLFLKTREALLKSKRDRLEILKLAIAEEPWEYQLYDKLDTDWSNFQSFSNKIEKDSWKPVQRSRRDFWVSLHAEKPKNHCAGYFRVKYIDINANGLYDPNNRASDGQKLTLLKRELEKYDGTNGAECAARLALWIAEIYQTPYSPEKNFDLAKQFVEKSKQIKSDLKDDPNTISGIATTADESLANVQYWQAQDDAWKKELAAMKERGEAAAAGGSRDELSGADPIKVRAALAAFDRIHPRIERLGEQIASASGKVQSGGQFSNFYTGTRRRMSNLQSQISTLYHQLMNQHGDYLPRSIKSHLRSDLGKSTGIRNDWVTGEAYQTYQNDGCSNGWSGYGC